MKILVTGGAGYIGSHTSLELINEGHDIVVIDNLCNSSYESIKRVQHITKSKVSFYKLNLKDKAPLINIFKKHSIDAVFHFAGLKSVEESVKKPFKYYDNNICGTLALIEVMQMFNCKNLIFSSSATVYGGKHNLPIKEDFPVSATNPYGYSKLIIERFLQDIFISDSSWRISILRYFNPIGAHKSGLIGENFNSSANNLMPCILNSIDKKKNILNIYGNDYNTHDGTGVRDYIHVVDLAKGHIKALHALKDSPKIQTINLGTGRGYSVLDIIKAFEKVSGKKVNYIIKGRRFGDVATCCSDPSFAAKKLGWTSEFELEEMCADTWRWCLKNPNGYN